jgi:hypothetical protein
VWQSTIYKIRLLHGREYSSWGILCCDAVYPTATLHSVATQKTSAWVNNGEYILKLVAKGPKWVTVSIETEQVVQLLEMHILLR